ncbi:flagellar biosynthesis regulatory protein FlaF [Aureimonas endophytica]|uniref:Flagellar biosynthesis regulatory protein FlaF n=1 Tax=Aureimonas endophytica TaxID=2027858 RepID=A0A917ECQ7_9HYPH|nr:flagellar biosynthesis regulator FlaF [Aureimonas endophytica]GGE19794.1 flagellar biosynthesis regulatory protein FlaF [Aureimonas endophytica]
MYQFSYSEIRQDSGADARERERQALDRAIELMERAETAGVHSAESVEAIYATRTLWSILVEDLASPDNSLSEELRASLISIGLWVMREAESIRLGKSTSFRGIIDVTTLIREGLE